MVHTRVMPWTCKIFGLIYFSLELRSVYETIAGGVLVRSSEFRIQSDRRSSTSEVKFAIIKYGRTEHGFLSLYYYHHNIGPSDFFGNAIEQSWKCLICISVERRQWYRVNARIVWFWFYPKNDHYTYQQISPLLKGIFELPC